MQRFEKLAQYLREAQISQRAFGERLNPKVTQSAVTQWIQGVPIKPERVLEAAAATEWIVTPHDWRPDIYPHPDDGMPREGSQMRLRLAAASG